MKKYIFISLVFAFAVLNFNFNNASASDCAPGELFNTTTGERCGASVIVECPDGDLFSSSTGERCNTWKNDSSGNLTAQFKVGDRGESVRVFQQVLKDEGFLVSGKVDGIYGPITADAASRYYVKYGPSYAPIISGVSGPQSLNINQEGTWTVKASSSTGVNLSYSVDWGDDQSQTTNIDSALARPAQQSATFTHSYSRAGTYTPTFMVTSPNTIACFRAPCFSNEGSAKTSLSVRVGSITKDEIGYLYIIPEEISLELSNSNFPIKAYYQAPMPDCLSGCLQVMPNAVEASARWSIKDPDIAEFHYIGGACIGCKSYPVIDPVSTGITELIATYQVSGHILTANAEVTVSD